MAAITLNNIDKSNWKPFPFEKIAKRISESVDPNKTELEVYIGLEHLDAETVHIRRHGSPADVSGGKLKCYPGDVIFGKRRAYQRKAGIVTQEGICSAHSFVFRANEEVIDAKLFPFFLHSDQFMHRMVDISVGGLSPTINWSDLKHQEFLLPPKDQQAELAELLWAMDTVIEKDLEVLERLEVYSTQLMKTLFDKGYPIKKLKEIAEFRRGSFPQPYGNPEWYDNINGMPFIQVNDIGFNFKLNDKPNYYISEKAIPYSVFVPKNSIIISIQGSIGRLAITQYDAYVDRTIIIFTKFFFETDYYFISRVLKGLFELKEKSARGAIIKTITKEELSEFEVIFPHSTVQKEIGQEIKNMEDLLNDLKSKLQSSKALQKALINQVF